MEILIGYLVFAIVVAIAAGSRGRNGALWLLIAVIFSPLVGLILVLVLPSLREEERQDRLAGTRAIMAKAGIVDTSTLPFEPDGVYSGVPYKVAQDGSIEAIMQGAKVRFTDMNKFMSAMAA